MARDHDDLRHDRNGVHSVRSSDIDTDLKCLGSLERQNL